MSDAHTLLRFRVIYDSRLARAAARKGRSGQDRTAGHHSHAAAALQRQMARPPSLFTAAFDAGGASGFAAASRTLTLFQCQELPGRQAANLLRCADKQLY